MYKLSKRSKSKLEGINPQLRNVVERAIYLTDVDFGVICGLRTEQEQRRLVHKGLSQTMKSKHLTGHAVDLMAYMGRKACWELNVYDEIAEAMRQSAKEYGVAIRWGGAWNVDDITQWQGTMEEAMNFYIDVCRAKNKKPFIDAPHFEIMLDKNDRRNNTTTKEA